MYTKTTFQLGLAALFMSAAISLSSCKKDKEDPEAAETELAEQSQDEADFSAETEQVLNDADLAVFNSVDVPGGRLGNFCGAQVDTTTGLPRIYSITFDGVSECNGRIRSGSVILTLYNGDRWADKDAVFGVEFRSFGVRRVAGNRTITINAAGEIYNVSGGLARQVNDLAGPDSIVHRIRMDGARMSSEGVSLREWHVAKMRFFVNRGRQYYTITTAGDTTIGDQTLVAVFGKSRRNRDFVTRFNRPIRSNSDCGWFKPVSGQKQHMGFARSVVVTFGVDDQGAIVNQGGGEKCAYGYKVEWTGIRGNQVRINPYR